MIKDLTYISVPAAASDNDSSDFFRIFARDRKSNTLVLYI